VEIRARYLLIGLFVVAVALAGAGFIYWLSNAGGLGQRVTYRVDFNGSVAGLLRGSAVQFNGITVGEVTDLQLIADRPTAVMATISVDKATPLRADTHVGLDFGGLTGTATVALRGGGNDPVPAAADRGPPILVADPSALKGMTQAARDVLGQLSVVINENADSLRTTIANIDTFSDALSRNSDRVDGILQGLARLTGGGETKSPPILYDLTAPRSLPAIAALPAGQLAVVTPTAVVALDTQRVLQQSADGDAPAFEGVQWADSIPLLFQARIIQSFENANYLRVAPASDTYTGDYRLVVDIRKFRLATSPSPAGEVEFSAKIVSGDGKVIDGRIFTAAVPALTVDAPSAVKALGGAFDKAATDLVIWALATMPAG
jgi:phospholipid/cholesterol/gamma-HCH transport system substrate-binding protein